MEPAIATFGKKKEVVLEMAEEEDDQFDANSDERCRSLEDVDSDELDGDLNLSDNEEEA